MVLRDTVNGLIQARHMVSGAILPFVQHDLPNPGIGWLMIAGDEDSHSRSLCPWWWCSQATILAVNTIDPSISKPASRRGHFLEPGGSTVMTPEANPRVLMISPNGSGFGSAGFSTFFSAT